ncbi:MAG: terminase family protein [Deltaproteobacteria bacterium]|uniref:Terminase family protein n=1 Tax=Candidatus Zymogenus saltonus TaxID=2844893 RepID=A0A9D8KEH8_9DELT|nr:terminase family protein [Candidatus Zymogenus saltonus]
MTKTKRIKLLLYPPHPGQKELHASSARFRVAACGRRWGKTVAATNEIVKHAWEAPRTLCFWVAPVYRQSMIAFDLVRKSLPKGAVAKILTSEMRVALRNGSVIEFRSAEIPRNLRGFGIYFLVLDECAFLPKLVWEDVMRPALSDREGRALFISTPKGRNWFYSLFTRGRDAEDTNWESFTFPTSGNPFIKGEEIEEAKKDLSDQRFRQEYLAEFIDDASMVFPGVGEIIRGGLQEPVAKRSYFAGLDIARHTDYTVLTILNSTGSLVYFDRFNKCSWSMIKGRVVAALKRYNNAVVWVDSTGVGDPFLENLRRSGIDARGYAFTRLSKGPLIENLILGIEEGRIMIPHIEVLVDELMMFEKKITETGYVTYSAPSGHHDDCVVSLALALWGMRGIHVSQADFDGSGFRRF